MLKKLILVFTFLLVLVGCRPASTSVSDEESFSIVSYNKIPSLSLISLIKDNDQIDIYDDINLINNAFDENEKDIIISPLNTGINKCLSSDNYKLLSIIAYSNYAIYAIDETFNKGDVAVYNGGLVIEGVLDKLSTSFNNYNFIYYDSLDSIIEDLSNDVIEAVVVDNMDYNIINNTIVLSKIGDINEIYTQEYSYSHFPTYGMFVKSSLIKEKQSDLASFTRLLRNSITQYKSDTTTLENALKDVDINMFGYSDKDSVISNYNDSGLEFVYAVDAYDELVTLFSLFDIEINESIIVQ